MAGYHFTLGRYFRTVLFEMTRGRLEPVPFVDFEGEGKLEAELEELIAGALFGQLFEGDPLLPFARERKFQPEADILALDKQGNVIIFELKRSSAAEGALAQALRYAQSVQKWRYERIEETFRRYWEDSGLSLRQFHKEAFVLESPLTEREFNLRQRMVIIGSALDDDLADAIEYWQRQGLDIEFMPYRLYALDGKRYLEFFAKPNDRHVNPGQTKGVIFDTNKSWNPKALGEMMAQDRVSAYGGRVDAINAIQTRDYVFLYHGGVGIVAAGRARGPLRTGMHEYKGEPEPEAFYDVDYEAKPSSASKPEQVLTIEDVTRLTGKRFYLARTDKRPFLTREESELLLAEIRRRRAASGPTART